MPNFKYMPNFKLVLEYDGSGFEGWQVQPAGRRTVQGCLVAAVERICGGAPRVTGSGRTDAGVHAEGQVASVLCDTRLGPEELRRAINGNLPRDVVVISLESAPEHFDARRHASSKLYRYCVWNGPQRAPLRAARSYHVPAPLDRDAMVKAAGELTGPHDFACFQATGSGVGSTQRTIFRLDVLGEPGAEIVFEVEGSGFLRHMVRNVAGTLVEVGQGRRSSESMAALLEARDRGLAGPTAPPAGLSLVRVDYPDPLPPALRDPPPALRDPLPALPDPPQARPDLSAESPDPQSEPTRGSGTGDSAENSGS